MICNLCPRRCGAERLPDRAGGVCAMPSLPVAARGAVLALALVTAVAGIGGAAVLDAGAGWFRCPACGALFVPTMAEYVKGYHTFTRRKLTCPECGKRGMCRHRVVF